MKRFIFTGIIILFVMAGCGGDHSSTDGLITVDVNDSYSTKKELVLSRLHGYGVYSAGNKR